MLPLSPSCFFLIFLALVGSFKNHLLCQADPTDGFTAIPLSVTNFELQKPYNIPLDQRYSYVDGVRKLWVYSNDRPFEQGSTTKPRTEIEIRGLDYSSGVWQFEGYTFVPKGTSAVNIVQIHGISESATCLQLRIYNGDLWFLDYNLIEKNLYDRWFRVNVIHDVNERNLLIFVNGVQKYETKDHGPGEFYFKCGVYAEDDASHYMESRWKNIKIYKK